MILLRAIGSGFGSNARNAVFGLLGQGSLSAANLSLVVVAAQVLGPSGVGTLMVGFSAYLVTLGFQRGLITEPLITSSSGDSADARLASSRSALSLTLVTSMLATFLLISGGVLIPGDAGRGMLLFAPWIVPALVHDLGRSIAFRDHRGGVAALCDATWLVSMALMSPIVIASSSDLAIAACWGVGATVGAIAVLSIVRIAPAPASRAWLWWRRDAWPFGRWLLAGGVAYNVATYGTVLALIGVLGAAEYGGLRAIQAIFVPLTLLAPALSLTGLPLVSRIVGTSTRDGLVASLKLGAVATIASAIYVLLLYAIPNGVALVFGPEFGEFRSLIVPIGLGQLLLALAFGLTLFLKAQQNGRALLSAVLVYVLFAGLLPVLLGSMFGLTGAAWGGVLAVLVYGAALIAAVNPRSVLQSNRPQRAVRYASSGVVGNDVSVD